MWNSEQVSSVHGVSMKESDRLKPYRKNETFGALPNLQVKLGLSTKKPYL
jgi:hypothetical protein